MAASVSKINFTNTIPDELTVAILHNLDNASLNSAALTSLAWARCARDILSNRKSVALDAPISRWVRNMYSHLSDAVFQSSPEIKEVINETDSLIKQEKFINFLGVCSTTETQKLINTRNPLFMSCMNEYLRRNPSYKKYFKIT